MSNYVFCADPWESRNGPKEIVSEGDFERIPVAVDVVKKVCRVEELFHMLMLAVRDFNKAVFTRADQNRFNVDSDLENDFYRIEINSLAASFFTILDTYQEYLLPKKGGLPFSIAVDSFDDRRFDVCKALRNYIQHAGNFSITIRGIGRLCAMSETVSSVRVYANLKVALVDRERLHQNTLTVLESCLRESEEIDLYDVINNVVDVLSKVHKGVRDSHEYTIDYRDESQFLSRMEDRLRKFIWYYHETSDGVKIASKPYLFDRQIGLIEYLTRRYPCSGSAKGHYITTAPELSIARMAEADRDIQDFRDKGGVLEICGHTYTFSKYQKPFALK